MATDYLYQYKINWHGRNTIDNWSTVVQQLIEQFGLPGDKYQTELSAESLNVYFRSDEDLMWFTLGLQA